jgi:Alpha/beta hydrolase of unknown function (DUF900)
VTYFIDLRAESVGGSPVADVGDIVIRTDTEPNPNPSMSLAPALIAAVQGRDVLVGAHGFHVNRAEGMENLSHWTEWLNLGQNGVFVGVLWPGDARWVPFIDYPIEGDEAINSGQLLGGYLLAKLTGTASLSFASHSLGARVVLEAIRTLKGSKKLKAATLMAGAIDDTSLNDEYRDAASQMQKISVLASRSDDVLKWAFPAGNFLSGIVTRGDPYWHGALGRFGPNPPDQPSQVFPTPILPDSWEFGHFCYINCQGAACGPPQEAGWFQPASLIIPSENTAALPEGALSKPQGTATEGTQVLNWRQSWSAGFVSLRQSRV